VDLGATLPAAPHRRKEQDMRTGLGDEGDGPAIPGGRDLLRDRRRYAPMVTSATAV